MFFIQRFRSIVFDILLYVAIGIYLSLCLPIILFVPLVAGLKILHGLMHLLLFILRVVVGLRYKAEGLENLHHAIQQGPCLVACKHQSTWETIALPLFLDSFTIVLKSELGRIPLFGFYLKRLKMIFVDRDSRSQTIKSLLAQGRQAIDDNRSIFIFPEGTRTLPGTKPSYQPGIALLYRDLNRPVVPVALNSGVFWGRRSFLKKPGCVTIKFLPPVEPGLNREEFMTRLENDIETACQDLYRLGGMLK
jgi:1-acyl-sn-glycerol-3-phosphate acyltransferase